MGYLPLCGDEKGVQLNKTVEQYIHPKKQTRMVCFPPPEAP